LNGIKQLVVKDFSFARPHFRCFVKSVDLSELPRGRNPKISKVVIFGESAGWDFKKVRWMTTPTNIDGASNLRLKAT